MDTAAYTNELRVNAIILWAERMRHAYGPWVYDTERSKRHVPWEEALAFATCGSYSDLPEIIPDNVIGIMVRWENGEFPEWVTLFDSSKEPNHDR